MKKRLLVGLGNPGERFVGTRHNLGIEMARAWVRRCVRVGRLQRDWRVMKKYEAEMAEVMEVGGKGLVACPMTFMNESGRAVVALARQFEVEVADILVMHDELELSLGASDLRQGGSARGHNGLRSLEQALGSQDFWRLRLGIGRPAEQAVSDFVLGRFSTMEREVWQEKKDEALEAIDGWFE